MNLTYTISQNDRHGLLESDVSIEVDYNPEEDIVDSIMHVKVYCHRTKTTVNITAIMWDMFEPALDLMIDAINWSEVYLQQLSESEIPTI